MYDEVSCVHGISFTSLCCIFLRQAKQLKNYEDAVIAKRFAELDEDEVEALAEDLQRDDF
jgi:hypothetical protein